MKCPFRKKVKLDINAYSGKSNNDDFLDCYEEQCMAYRVDSITYIVGDGLSRKGNVKLKEEVQNGKPYCLLMWGKGVIDKGCYTRGI